MKKVLCISHDATLTGAPKLLLNLIGILNDHHVDVNVLVKNNYHSASFSKQFQSISHVYGTYFNTRPINLLSRIQRRIFGQTKPDLRRLLENVDLVLNNTLTNGDILPVIRKQYPGPIITYVHELEIACQTYTTPEMLKNTFECSDLFLVPCESVKAFLINKMGIDSTKIAILFYYIGFPEIKIVGRHAEKNRPYIIGGCGTLDWRKGADVFLQVAKAFIERFPEAEVLFRWKGAVIQSTDYRRIAYDIEKLKLSANVQLIESSLDTGNFYQNLDLFLLTSREDPYPLVVLEAAAYQIPTVCFANSGGASEFTADDAGDTVPYLSIPHMVEVIRQHQVDFAMTRRKGEFAVKKLNLQHQDAGLVLKQLQDAYLKAAQLVTKIDA